MDRNAHLNGEEKLAALRAADPFRHWNSLDDERVCFLCERTFTGRQVEITRGRVGRYVLQCPTERCASSPHEWVYPGNPYKSETAWHDWERVLGDDSTDEVEERKDEENKIHAAR